MDTATVRKPMTDLDRARRRLQTVVAHLTTLKHKGIETGDPDLETVREDVREAQRTVARLESDARRRAYRSRYRPHDQPITEEAA